MNAKNYGMTLKIGAAWIMMLILLGAVVVQAQDPAQLKEMFARSQQQNAEALKQYTWKSRYEVKKNGESKATKLYLMRYDAYGNIQQNQIGGSAPPDMPKGPLMRRIAEKKKEDFVELMNDLREQVKAYSHLSPEKMQAFLANATITAKVDQSIVQIKGGSILQPGDSMTIWLDVKTRRQRRVEIGTFLEKNAARAVIEFRDLPGGPTYMARTVVDYPKDSLQLITENFDYQLERR
ncbi:MAG TPA: hypothetical protein VLM38_09950 [Blastocatellia bacterium]|nr:hypothetical protein [Blastocatellia bacterium]